jgi:Mg2+/Co2+ transporter CorB
MNPNSNQWGIDLLERLAILLPVLTSLTLAVFKIVDGWKESVKIKAKEDSAGETAINELRAEIKELREENETFIRQQKIMQDDILEIKREFLQYLKSKIKD